MNRAPQDGDNICPLFFTYVILFMLNDAVL